MPLTTVPGALPGLLLLKSRLAMIDAYAGILYLQAKDNWGGAWWMLWADGVWLAPFIIEDDELAQAPIEFRSGWTTHAVYAICLGKWSYAPPTAAMDLIRNQFEASIGIAFEVEWEAPVSAEAYGDSAQLSNWVLTGVRRNDNCCPVDGWPTRARADIVLSTVGGVHTIYLYRNSHLVASGARSGDGSVTLSAQNNSGLSGSVDLAYTADITAAMDAYVEARWPQTYYIYESTTLLATIQDTGKANTYSKRVEGLSSGSHSLRMKVGTDTGQTSGYGSATAGTLSVRPPSPTAPLYISGDYTDTVIRFTSATPAWTAATTKALRSWVVPSTGPAGYAYECTATGTTHAATEPTWPTTIGNTVSDGSVTWTCRAEVTYQVYDSALDEPPNLLSISEVASASGTTVDVTLDALSAPGAGIRRVQIRSICASVEDPEGTVLEIEYASAGTVVVPAPNAPTARAQSIVGRVVTLRYSYDGAKDGVSVVTVKMWLIAEGASPNWASPDTSQAIGAADAWSSRRGTITATSAADGFYRWAVRTADASGNLSPNTTLSEAVWIGTATPTVPTPTLEVAA
jgi:hypothetical protein